MWLGVEKKLGNMVAMTSGAGYAALQFWPRPMPSQGSGEMGHPNPSLKGQQEGAQDNL